MTNAADSQCPECGHWLDADCYCPCCITAAQVLDEGNDDEEEVAPAQHGAG